MRICPAPWASDVMADGDQMQGVHVGPVPPGRTELPSLVLNAPAPPWPPALQWGVAGLILVCLALLGWRGWGLTRYSTRPLPLERIATLDLNEADEIDLQQLSGIGPALARRIVEHRPFVSVEDLRRVPGVGPQMLERLRQQVHVDPAYEGAPPPPPRVVRARAAEQPAPTGKKKPPEVPIDINRAPASELMRLPGIGPVMAARILEARREQPFASVGELRRVKGIGVKTLEKLRPHVVVGAAEE